MLMNKFVFDTLLVSVFLVFFILVISKLFQKKQNLEDSAHSMYLCGEEESVIKGRAFYNIGEVFLSVVKGNRLLTKFDVKGLDNNLVVMVLVITVIAFIAWFAWIL